VRLEWARRAGPLVALGVVAVSLAWASPARAGSIGWCGSGEPTVDVADAVSAFEWHIVYALPSDAPDRFAGYAPRLAGDVATISNWWLSQDPTRQPRFDLVDAPGCPTEPYGRVDISLVRLPRVNGSYAFKEIVSDLSAAGFNSPDKAYLIYYDGTLHAGEEYGVCGQGRTDSHAFAYAVVYLQSCGQSFSDDERALIATHEMVHGLGAVQPSAPHICDGGHVCDGSADLMKSVLDQGDWLPSLTLDIGRDDYYGHSGSWWDTRDSRLLYRLDASLDPAPEIMNLSATSVAGVVRIGWDTSVERSGVHYRIYDERGNYVREEPSSIMTATGDVGQTQVWTVRAVNDAGFLSRPATLRFKIGYGIVDSAGTLLRDTVAPTGVTGLRATRSGNQVALRWSAVADPIGLRGYRIAAPGMRPVVVSATTTRLALAAVRGKTLAVAAVDQAGNVGPASTVRAPR
jgi:hypothetical protein